MSSIDLDKAVNVNFTAAIDSGRKIACNSKGNWHYEWKITSFFRWLFGLQNSRDAGVIGAFNQSLAKLEKKVVTLNSPQDVRNSAFKTYLVASQSLIARFKNNRSKTVSKQINLLNRRIVALKYRIESGNGGLNKIELSAVKSEEREWLLKEAQDWKGTQVKFTLASKKELTKGSIARLEQALCYPEFIALLKQDAALFKKFLKWTITYRNDVCAFVEFPATQARLNMAQLSSRTGAFFGRCLSTARGKYEEDSKRGGEQGEFKDIRLRFATVNGLQSISILDENLAVTFSHNVIETIGAVFDRFKNKNGWIPFEILGGAITNWRADQTGPIIKASAKTPAAFNFGQVDLNHDKWWELLPPVAVISVTQAKSWYGEHCDGVNFGGKIVATRAFKDLRAEGTHSYIEVAAPMRNDDGEMVYHIYPFGKYPKKFPSKALDYPKAIAGTSDACICYPDQSVAERKREHDGPNLELVTPELGLMLMKAIKTDIEAGREGNLAYQLFTENCGMWSCKIASEIFPEKAKHFEELFATSFMNARPLGLAGVLFYIVKKLPRILQAPAISLIFLPLGSRIAKTVKRTDGTSQKISLAARPVWGAKRVANIPAVWFMKRDGVALPA